MVLVLVCLLRGVVLGVDGKGIADAMVMVKGKEILTFTDEKGSFELPLKEGEYTIVATRIGYKADHKKVKIKENEDVFVEFKLKKDIFQGEPIVVTATRTHRYIRDVPVRTEVLTSKLIDDKGASNLYEALQGVAGVRAECQCSYCNFTMVRIHGLGADHTQILIDGQPVYSGLAAVYGLEQILTQMVERIEIVKGAGSAIYGSGAIAGAINIITKKPVKNEAKLTLEFGSYNTNAFSFSASRKLKNKGISFFLQRKCGDAIDQSSDKGRIPDGYSDRVKTENFISGFNILFQNFLKGRFYLSGKNIYEFRQGGLLEEDTYENPFTESTERIITNRYEIITKYEKDLNHNLKINLSSAYSFHYRNATNDAFLCDYRATHNDSLPPLDIMRPYIAKEKIFTLNFNAIKILKNHRFLLGWQFNYNSLREKGNYVIVDTGDTNYGLPYTSFSEKNAKEFAIYLQDELSFGDNLEFIFGIRYDMHKSCDNFRGSGKVAPLGFPPVIYDLNSTNPRFAFKYKISSSLVIRGNIGTGFRVPYGFAEDLHLCSGSPRVWKGKDLKPEKSISYNISLDYAKENINFNLNFYRTDLKNKISFTEASDFAKNLGYTYEWKNIDDAYVQGIEAGFRFTFYKYFGVDFEIEINEGKYKHPREDWISTPYEKISQYISRLPLYAIHGELRMEKGIRFSLFLDYQGPMYIDYYKDEEIPYKIKCTEPYLLLNMKLSKKLAGNEIYFGVKNLTNYIQPERHTDDAAFIYAPIYGRLIYGGVKFNF